MANDRKMFGGLHYDAIITLILIEPNTNRMNVNVMSVQTTFLVESSLAKIAGKRFLSLRRK